MRLSLSLQNNLKASLTEVMIQCQSPTNSQLSHENKAVGLHGGRPGEGSAQARVTRALVWALKC